MNRKILFTGLLFWWSVCSVKAQQLQSCVLLTRPYSAADSVKLTKLILHLHDESAVIRAVDPVLKTRRIRADLSVAHSDGTVVVLNYDARRKRWTNLNDQMVLQSKGLSATFIGNPEQFRALGDTLVLLDTLRLEIGFSNAAYPREGYYMQVAGKTIRPSVIHHFLRVAPYRPGSYVPVVWHNTGSATASLWHVRFFFVNKIQQHELEIFLKALCRAQPGLKIVALRSYALNYLAADYGSPLEEQVDDWLGHIFPGGRNDR